MGIEPQKRFWANVLSAAEAEPLNARRIQGLSGIEHPVIAAAFDETRRRLLVVSGEHDARTAALAQMDIQSALQGVQVVVARPLALDFSLLAKTVTKVGGRTVFTLEELRAVGPALASLSGILKEQLDKTFAPLEFLGYVPLNVLAQCIQSIQQLALIQFDLTAEAGGIIGTSTFDIAKLASVNPLQLDNQVGVCPVPLYELSAEEIALMNDSENLDDVREVLHRHHLIQYFFPAPDVLALGLIDRGPISNRQTLLEQLQLTSDIGHPFGQMELTQARSGLTGAIDELQDRGLVVEGDLALEIGPEGRKIRTNLRFQPREGLISKVINRFSFRFDLKDFLGPK